LDIRSLIAYRDRTGSVIGFPKAKPIERDGLLGSGLRDSGPSRTRKMLLAKITLICNAGGFTVSYFEWV
jgi:hypothetical protein